MRGIGQQVADDERGGHGQGDAQGIATDGGLQAEVVEQQGAAQAWAGDEKPEVERGEVHLLQPRGGMQFPDAADDVADLDEGRAQLRERLGRHGVGLHLLGEQVQFVLQGALFGCVAYRAGRHAVAGEGIGDGFEIAHGLEHHVAQEDQHIALAEVEAQGGVIGVGGHHLLIQVEHAQMDLDETVVARILLGLQHHVAGGLLLLGQHHLLADEGGVLAVEIGGWIVETGLDVEIACQLEQAFGEHLLLDAVALAGGDSHGIGEIQDAAEQEGRRGAQRLVGGTAMGDRQRHGQQHGKLDRHGALAIEQHEGRGKGQQQGDGILCERMRLEQTHCARGQGIEQQRDGQFAHLAAQGAGLVDEGKAGGSESHGQCQPERQQPQGGQRHCQNAAARAQPRGQIVAVPEGAPIERIAHGAAQVGSEQGNEPVAQHVGKKGGRRERGGVPVCTAGVDPHASGASCGTGRIQTKDACIVNVLNIMKDYSCFYYPFGEWTKHFRCARGTLKMQRFYAT